MDSPFGRPPCHPHPSYLLHGAVAAAAVTFVAGYSVYAATAGTGIVAPGDRASCPGAVDPSRPDCRHCSRAAAAAAADDAEAYPAVARDSAL